MSRILKRQLDSSSESETENFEVTSSISQVLDLEAVSSINDTNGSNLIVPTPDSKHTTKKPKTSTPHNKRDAVDNLEKTLDLMIESHKVKLKKLREKVKADNIEFLFVVRSELNEGQLAMNNEDAIPVHFKGEDLMKMIAGPDPAHFGRELAKKLFGKDENCLLIHSMIGHERCRANARERIESSLEQMFERVVKQKYPREPDYCLREARAAANQLGLDYKKKCALKTVNTNNTV